MVNLNKEDREIYNKLKLEATTDHYLGLLALGWKGKVEFIYDGDEKVGFFHPQISNGLFLRAGVVFVSKPYRKKGLAKKALQEYFQDDKDAVAWVLTTNKASNALFKSLGFEKDGESDPKMLNGNSYQRFFKEASKKS